MKLKGERTITNEQIEKLNNAIETKTMTKGAAIREMFAGGLAVKEISDATGIRYNHVYNVINNEILVKGIQKLVEHEDRGGSVKKEQILELLQSGLTIAQVSTQLRCMYNYVWQIAKAAGLTKKQNTPELAVETVKTAKKVKSA
jgi:DNA-binding NarL/FixJ family response regulator